MTFEKHHEPNISQTREVYKQHLAWLNTLSVEPAVSLARSATLIAANSASWSATASDAESVKLAERSMVNKKFLSIVKDEIGKIEI